jgi:hypothetical protein
MESRSSSASKTERRPRADGSSRDELSQPYVLCRSQSKVRSAPRTPPGGKCFELTIRPVLAIARIIRKKPGTPVIVLGSRLSERLRDYPKGEECVSDEGVSTRIHREPWRLALRLRSRNTARQSGATELFNQEADMRRTFVALALGALVVAGWPPLPRSLRQPRPRAAR